MAHSQHLKRFPDSRPLLIFKRAVSYRLRSLNRTTSKFCLRGKKTVLDSMLLELENTGDIMHVVKLILHAKKTGLAASMRADKYTSKTLSFIKVTSVRDI